MEEQWKLKQNMKLYTGKFLCFMCTGNLFVELMENRGKGGQQRSNSMGAQDHRENIPKMQKCDQGGGESSMYFC